MNAAQSRSARRALDQRLGQLPPAALFTPPNSGWIRAIRDALGMSGADLATRLNVTSASVSDIEKSESEHRVRLDTLERAAAAMGCDLVYAMIPHDDSLGGIVARQAQAKVADQLRAVGRAMDLEAQSAVVADEVVSEEMRRLVNSGTLWK